MHKIVKKTTNFVSFEQKLPLAEQKLCQALLSVRLREVSVRNVLKSDKYTINIDYFEQTLLLRKQKLCKALFNVRSIEVLVKNI